MPARVERAQAARHGAPLAGSPDPVVARRQARGDLCASVQRLDVDRWRQDVTAMLDPATARRERRKELESQRAKQRGCPKSAASMRLPSERPASAPALIPEPTAVPPGTYTLLRDVVPQERAELDSRPEDGGNIIRAGAPFFVVQTALVRDRNGEGILRVKDASRGWISTIDRTGRYINSRTGRHEDATDKLEAQHELEDQRKAMQLAAAKGAALVGEGSPPWVSSGSRWWAAQDRRKLDQRLAAAREAELSHRHPTTDELTTSRGNAEPRDEDVENGAPLSLRDELDQCFGCGDLVRVEAALGRAEQHKDEVQREQMGMVVRMLSVYATGLRESQRGSSCTSGRQRQQRPATAPSGGRGRETQRQAQRDTECAVDHALSERLRSAQEFVQRAKGLRRLSLNPFVVGRNVEMPEAIGPPVYSAGGEELTGRPYHVDRRRDLHDARKILARTSSQPTDRTVHTARRREETYKVVWDEATQSYQDFHVVSEWVASDSERSESDLKTETKTQTETETETETDIVPQPEPEPQAQPVSRPVRNRPGDAETATKKPETETETATNKPLVTGGDKKQSVAVSKLRAALRSQKQQQGGPSESAGDLVANVVGSQLSQVRADRFQRRQQRLAGLRAATAAVQAESERAARVHVLFGAVSSGSVDRLERIGLLRAGAGQPETLAQMGQRADNTSPPPPPAGLSKVDAQRWLKRGLPPLSPLEVEALLIVRNSCGQTPLDLARDRGQTGIYDHLVQILCEHLAAGAVADAFGAEGGGIDRIEQVRAMVAMLPARLVRRSAFYNDWMALEEYYKLLLREAAEQRAAETKAKALAKRRKAEEAAAMRRRRREEVRSRRTEAGEKRVQHDEEVLLKASADELEAKVAAALEEADQARRDAVAELEAAKWAARRLTRRAKKRAQKGGWRLNASGFEQLGVAGGKNPGVSEDLMFFDSVAVQVL